MTVKVTMLDGKPYDIDVKRFHVPVQIEATCPKCGFEFIEHLDSYYLSYPRAFETFKHYMYCQNDACEHEWPVNLLLTLKLELVDD